MVVGAWGIMARECDAGLDYLHIAQRELLSKNGYARFDVPAILDLLHSHIHKAIVSANEGADAEDMALYYDAAYPGRYGYAVLLVAECLADFLRNGALELEVFENGTAQNPTSIKITEFAYTKETLAYLYNELRRIAAPGHAIYRSWKGTPSFPAWQSYMHGLYDTIGTHTHRLN